MPKNVSQYRLSSASLATAVGVVGQIIVNTTKNVVHIMDGVTPGGFEHALADASNIQEANSEQDGKMTKELVQQQEANTTAITANAVAIAANASDISDNADAAAAAQAAADNAIPTVASPTAGNIAFLKADGTIGDNGFPFFNEGTLVKFASSLPIGWTLNTSYNDRVDLTTDTEGDIGNISGSWNNSTGISISNHTIAKANLPTGVTGSFDAADFNNNSAMFSNSAGIFSISNITTQTTGTGHDGTPNSGVRISFDLGGSGTALSHSISSTSAWRPSYVKTGWGARDAAA